MVRQAGLLSKNAPILDQLYQLFSASFVERLHALDDSIDAIQARFALLGLDLRLDFFIFSLQKRVQDKKKLARAWFQEEIELGL